MVSAFSTTIVEPGKVRPTSASHVAAGAIVGSPNAGLTLEDTKAEAARREAMAIGGDPILRRIA
jgi:hypothetical protein